MKWVSVSLIALVFLTEVGVESWYRWHERGTAATRQWVVNWPEQNEGFETRPLTKSIKEILRYDKGSAAAWNSVDTRWQGFFFEWKPSRNVYDRVRVGLSKSHNPEVCLTGAGMIQKAQLPVVSVDTGKGFALGFRRYIYEARGEPLYVFFSVSENMAHGAAPGYLRRNTKERIQAALAGSRNYGQRTIEIAIHGVANEAEALEVLRRELPPMIVTW